MTLPSGTVTLLLADVEGSTRLWETSSDQARSAKKVIELVAEGLSNPQVAERLIMSPRAVSTHLSHVFAKLGVSSRGELAAAALKRSV